MKNYIAILFVALFAFSCAGKQEAKAPEAEAVETVAEEVVTEADTAMVAEADSTAVEEEVEEDATE